MNGSRNSGPWALIIVAAAVALGALREFLFLNLNYQLDAVARQRTISYAHSMFQAWVEGWDLDALLRLKWVLAIAFITLMATASVLLARVLFGDHRHRRNLLLGFALASLLALALHALGAVHPAFPLVALKVLHALQYPVVLLFLWAAHRIGASNQGR